MLTYKITMSDGTRLDIQSNKASDAIQRALKQRPGTNVLGCYTGYKKGNRLGKEPAFIDYEIPTHEALSPAWEKVKRQPAPITEAFGFLEDIPVNERR